ncbi:hypothetical protein BS50DRAFT_142078 [Corynespora cassiicola Philippines]|uniref:Uncharacterized protein n=1 Tax=Corynespora cassiicola Philippines TaxID=1448308 RepID=A0A2T2NA53_CORCC|nr:hypothetical protein BS50DRAFT_142078 [Corynespora cassiicola Philippines]
MQWQSMGRRAKTYLRSLIASGHGTAIPSELWPTRCVPVADQPFRQTSKVGRHEPGCLLFLVSLLSILTLPNPPTETNTSKRDLNTMALLWTPRHAPTRRFRMPELIPRIPRAVPQHPRMDDPKCRHRLGEPARWDGP